MTKRTVPLTEKTATKIVCRQNWQAVKYHDTEVVGLDDSRIILNSGGWNTVTTLRRMNQAAQRFLLHFHVYQEKHEWFVKFANEEPIPFYDGITLSRDRSEPCKNERVLPGEEAYNGWTNRATWNVMLWLSNTEAHYRAYTAAARRQAFTVMSAKRFAMRAFGYRSMFAARTPDGDMLNRADWPAIAEALNEAANGKR